MTISAPELYGQVARAISGTRHAQRIRMNQATWDGLIDQLDKSLPPLKLPPSSEPVLSDSDMALCVGMLNGLPVLIKSSVPDDKFELE